MEALSRLIDKAVMGGFLSGYKLRNRVGEEITILHFLFADDTLIFCKDSRDEMAFLSWTLMWLEAIFGLKVNLRKVLYFQWERWQWWKSWLWSWVAK